VKIAIFEWRLPHNPKENYQKVKLLFSICIAVSLLSGCGTPKSALNWNKLKVPYHERVMQARTQQVEKIKKHGGSIKSELQITEEAVDEAVNSVFDGKEAEIRLDNSHPLSERGLREWRVEELILLYNPEIMGQLAGLDQMATGPNLLLAILNQLQLSGSAALVGGIFEIKSNESGNSELIFSNDGRSVYETRLNASLGFGSFFEDTRSLIAFERNFLQFRNNLITKHAKLWPIVETYSKIDAGDRKQRSDIFVRELLGRE